MLIRNDPPPDPGRPAYTCSFPSTDPEKTKAREKILDYLVNNSIITEKDLFWCRLVLDEAMANAVIHGNNSDPGTSVTVRIFFNGKELTVYVADQGNGFQDSEVPSSEDSDALSREHGRGVELIHHYMDRVVYYSGG